MAGWLSALLVLVTQGDGLGWLSAPAIGLGVATLVLLAWWLRTERRRPAPLVDLDVMGERTVALTNGAALCIGCGIFMAYAPLAPMAQAPASTGYGLALTAALGRCSPAGRCSDLGRRSHSPPWPTSWLPQCRNPKSGSPPA